MKVEIRLLGHVLNLSSTEKRVSIPEATDAYIRHIDNLAELLTDAQEKLLRGTGC